MFIISVIVMAYLLFGAFYGFMCRKYINESIFRFLLSEGIYSKKTQKEYEYVMYFSLLFCWPKTMFKRMTQK